MENELPSFLGEIFNRPIFINHDLIQSKSVTTKIKEYNKIVEKSQNDENQDDLCKLILNNEKQAEAEKVYQQYAHSEFDQDKNAVPIDPKDIKKVKTAGKSWFDMKAPELTDEVLMDLKAIKMRNLIYKKRFYKGNDSRELPKFFQIGTVVSNGNEMGDEKLTRKERRGRIAESFLDDDQGEGLTDKKFVQITDKRRRMGNKKRFLKEVTKKKKRGH
ncbi:unnamed protein product [Moneuplotes crassus]|uniref:Fcf2 pre-rRNA processing C-terminal domain-containing protein n=1 Tax=Euplotes crassus TaxID=5936 RepID=A0AAD1XTS4_EUPCR|nr:unnamed protein product [Moneuplotes crassus]